MIQISISVQDSSRSVVLTAFSDEPTISFYRRIGLSPEIALTTAIPVVDGVATFIDVNPPEKTLLSYAAMTDIDRERSNWANAVMPTSWALTRPALAGDIRLGDMLFNTIDETGTVWTITDIDGWWTIPESEIPSSERSREENGSYDENGRYLSRSLVLSGVFLPSSIDQLEASRSKLITAVDAVRRTVDLRVDETPPRRMTVRLSGKTHIDTVRQSGLTEFTVELHAPDPIKYSLDEMYQPDTGLREPISVGAGTQSVGRTYPRDYDTDTDNLREYGLLGSPNAFRLVNEGNYPSPPFFRITGPVTNPRIEHIETGEKLEFVLTLQDGEYLDVNVKEKTVLLNGAVSRRGSMTFNSEWFYLPPGTNSLRYTTLSSPGDLSIVTVTAYSAWLG